MVGVDHSTLPSDRHDPVVHEPTTTSRSPSPSRSPERRAGRDRVTGVDRPTGHGRAIVEVVSQHLAVIRGVAGRAVGPWRCRMCCTPVVTTSSGRLSSLTAGEPIRLSLTVRFQSSLTASSDQSRARITPPVRSKRPPGELSPPMKISCRPSSSISNSAVTTRWCRRCWNGSRAAVRRIGRPPRS